MNSNTKSHIDRIDVLRGIAILGVFLFHSQSILFQNIPARSYVGGKLVLNNFHEVLINFSPTSFGGSGVQLFLLISGFLIHYGYLCSTKIFSVTEFYSKRFWRIYPPYFLAICFFVFVNDVGGIQYYLHQKVGGISLIFHLLFIHNFSNKTFYGINVSFWSLALEMQLYLIYPIFLFLRNKLGVNKTIGATLIISFILLGGGMYLHILSAWNYNTSILKMWYVWAAGALLAEKYFLNKKLFQKGVKSIIIFSFLLSGASIATSYTNNFTDYFLTLGWLAFFEWFLYTKTISLNTAIFKILSTIGICSYSIYLIHQPLLKVMLNFFDRMSLINFGHLNIYLKSIDVIPVFIIVFLISYSLYIFIELPSVSIGKYFRGKKGVN